ncbi:MAG: hypothetical protein CBC13_02010, partial [Planctomycetia bacterium TMED53]
MTETDLPTPGNAPSEKKRSHALGLLSLGLFVLIAAVITWRVPHLFRAIQEARNLGPEAFQTNGFDLPVELLEDPSFIRWGVPGQIIAVDNPAVWGQEKVEELAKNFRKRFLISSSEVVGVRFGSEARAYPLRLLQWHEVVNDVVGGIPICVVYHPLSETICVFKRRADSTTGKPLLFGNSGLILDCCMLLNDRKGTGNRKQETLWSPVDGRALYGPLAGENLEFLPFSLTTWSEWLEAAPETVVMAMLESHRNYYKKEPYLPYRQRDLPKYPYSPEAPEGRKKLSRVKVVGQGSNRSATPTDGSDLKLNSEPFTVS